MNQVMITPTNDTIEVARSLVGQNFIILASDEVKRARIVETEAYLGHDDPACHTFGGRRTPRTEPMYGRFGEAYVYLIYGMYHCLNFVTGRGEAVLIRALEPLEGFTEDQKQRKVLSGPGRLCRELEITRSLNHQSLLDSQTQIHLDEKSPSLKGRLLEGSRVGVNYAGDAAHWPLRFGLEGSSFISKPFSKDHFGL